MFVSCFYVQNLPSVAGWQWNQAVFYCGLERCFVTRKWANLKNHWTSFSFRSLCCLSLLLSVISVIVKEFPDLNLELTTEPENVISCLGLAMHQVRQTERLSTCYNLPPFLSGADEFAENLLLQILSTDLEKDLNEGGADASYQLNIGDTCQVPKIHCRITNTEPVAALKSLKANYCGQFTLVLVREICARLSSDRRHSEKISLGKWLPQSFFLLFWILSMFLCRKICHCNWNHCESQ